MSKFNNGKPYHGSDAVKGGKLQGATDTDYFYFFCPKCPDKQIMRILDYGLHASEDENPYNAKMKKKAKEGFTLVFKLYCENCKLMDFVKISNMGQQGGSYREVLARIGNGQREQ